MTKAEERALEAYPNEHFVDHTYAEMCRGFYEEGYEQAEKDLALTWEDVKAITTIADSLLTGTAWDAVDWPDEQKYYEEVLKRFKEAKK